MMGYIGIINVNWCIDDAGFERLSVALQLESLSGPWHLGHSQELA